MNFYKLYEENCLKTIIKLDDGSLDLIVTDPPYFRIVNDGWDNQWKTYDDFLLWLKEVINVCYNKLSDNGSMYVFTAFGDEFNNLVKTIFETKFNITNMLMWQRSPSGRKHSRTRYTLNYELIWFLTKENYNFNLDSVRIPQKYKDKRNNPLGKNPGSIWYYPNIMLGRNKKQLGHPTQKPEELIERMILASSNKGDVVFDPFLGSGTTMAVSQKLERSCIGSEINLEYCEIIKNRCNPEVIHRRRVSKVD